MEQHNASIEMKAFFEKLLDIKQFVKEAAENTGHEIISEIYNKLHTIIQTPGDQK